MSGMAMEWVHHLAIDKQLDRTAHLVLLDIADHANVRTGEAWPSASEIADRLRLDYGTVRRAFDRIEESGILSVIHRSGKTSMWSGLPRALAPLTPRAGAADPARQRATNKVVTREEQERAIAACLFCDDHGWLWHDDRIARCTHNPQERDIDLTRTTPLIVTPRDLPLPGLPPG